MTPHKLKNVYYLKEAVLVYAAGRMIHFVVEQVFLLMGEVWFSGGEKKMLSGGGRRPKGRIVFKFSLSCHNIKFISHSFNIDKNSIEILVCSTDFRNKTAEGGNRTGSI